MKTSRNTAWAFFVVFLVIQGMASAQSPFAGLEAEGKQAGAPEWLREGVRLTYRMSAAAMNVIGTGYETANSGIAHVDITSVAKGTASGNVSNWNRLLDAPGAAGGWVPSGSSGFSKPAGLGDFWAHPRVLVKAAEKLSADRFWKVERGPYEVFNKKVEAVTFTYADPAGQAVSRHVFDAQTGIALFFGESRRQFPGAVLLPVTTIEFLSIRERKLPWIEGRPPAWIFKTKRLVFEGSRTISSPGGYPFQSGIRYTLDKSAQGPNFIAGQLKMEQEGVQPQMSFVVSGASSASGFWLPPLGLQEVARNFRGAEVEIDADPVTGARTAVVFTGVAPHGRNVVTLREQTGGYASWSDYEVETGILIQWTTQIHALFTSVQVFFAGLE